jgi:hypothetical protein
MLDSKITLVNGKNKLGIPTHDRFLIKKLILLYSSTQHKFQNVCFILFKFNTWLNYVSKYCYQTWSRVLGQSMLPQLKCLFCRRLNVVELWRMKKWVPFFEDICFTAIFNPSTDSLHLTEMGRFATSRHGNERFIETLFFLFL